MRTWLSKSLYRILHGSDHAVFLHIQKTAGTSLVHLAARHYGQENIITHGDYADRSPESLTAVPFVSGHFGYDYAKDLIKSRKSFTFLRDPVDRILSLYDFYRSQDPSLFPMYRIAHECSLSEFLVRGLEDRYVKSRIWNNQAWQLAHGYGCIDKRSVDSFAPEELLDLAMSHLRNFSFVGLSENYGADARSIAKMLGWSRDVDDVRENVNKRSSFSKDLSSQENSLMEELTSLDTILYRHVKSTKSDDIESGESNVA